MHALEAVRFHFDPESSQSILLHPQALIYLAVWQMTGYELTATVSLLDALRN